MDVVELDLVMMGVAVAVAPDPTDGNARITEIGDFVVRDSVVRAVADPHPDRAAEQMAAVADDVVVDYDVAGQLLRLRMAVVRAVADAYAAGSKSWM